MLIFQAFHLAAYLFAHGTIQPPAASSALGCSELDGLLSNGQGPVDLNAAFDVGFDPQFSCHAEETACPTDVAKGLAHSASLDPIESERVCAGLRAENRKEGVASSDPSAQLWTTRQQSDRGTTISLQWLPVLLATPLGPEESTPKPRKLAWASYGTPLRMEHLSRLTSATMRNRFACKPREFHYNCAVRKAAGKDIVRLDVLRGLGRVFHDWLRGTPPSPPGSLHGCRHEPLDGSPLRIEVHAENMEFGYELVQLAPYAHAACMHGMLRLRSLCTGMRPFYYFAAASDLQAANDVPCIRYYQNWDTRNTTWSMHSQHKQPVGNFWERQPPYRMRFCNPAMRRNGRTIALVLAKQGIVGRPKFMPEGVRNAWSISGLLKLLKALSARADQVYYFRAGAVMPSDQTGDAGPNVYNDTAEIRARLPRVRLLQDTVQSGHRYSEALNKRQLEIAATADVVVATQGGAAVLASLVATRLAVLCRVGKECNGNPPDVHWWRLLNKATIVKNDDEAALTRQAVQLLDASKRKRGEDHMHCAGAVHE